MPHIRTCGIVCCVCLLGAASLARAQVIAGVDVVKAGEPSEVAGHIGFMGFYHLVAVRYSKLTDEERGKGCSIGAMYEFTPLRIFSQATNRFRRVQPFVGGSIGAVYHSCTSSDTSDEALTKGIAQHFNAEGSVGGGVRVVIFQSEPLVGLIRVEATSRRLFGTGRLPGLTTSGVAAGFTILVPIFFRDIQ